MEFLVICALLGLIPALIADKKGRSLGAWWLYGALLFIIALPHALLLDPKTPAKSKKCPACAEFVKEEAIVCRFCGRDLPTFAAPVAKPTVPLKEYNPKGYPVISIGLFIVLGAFAVFAIIAMVIRS